jgi:hypothetical protein
VRVRERVGECLCAREKESMCERDSVRMRESEREREGECLCVREKESVCVSVCERDSVRKRV